MSAMTTNSCGPAYQRNPTAPKLREHRLMRQLEWRERRMIFWIILLLPGDEAINKRSRSDEKASRIVIARDRATLWTLTPWF
jgi:hypothetical protein